MRLEHIHLRDFRGVSDREVSFETTGVTVVEGDNEAGKSSIAEAFRLLLEFKHGSKHRELTAVRPVGRDVGPRVTAIFTLGQYRLFYTKQWLASATTELIIEGPSPEQLAGDVAHERVLELLEQEADMNLFQSLWYAQGDALAQASVGDSPSLLSALKASADLNFGDADVLITTSGEPGNQDALLERARVERDRYWTATGQLRKEPTARRERLQLASVEVQEIESQIIALERTASRHQELDLELIWLNSEKNEIEADVTKAQSHVASLASRSQAVAQARTELQLRQSEQREWIRRGSERRMLVARAEDLKVAVGKLESDETGATSAHNAAQSAVTDAAQLSAQAEKTVADAQSAHSLSRELVEGVRLQTQLADLQARHRIVTEADAAIALAAQQLSGAGVTADLVQQIDAADRELVILTARAEAGAPQITLRALTPVAVQIDGTLRELRSDEQTDATVFEQMTIRIGDLAAITVNPPAQQNDARTKLADARRRLHELLRAASVDTPARASELLQERERVERQRQTAADRREAALAGVNSADELAGRLAGAHARASAIGPQQQLLGPALTEAQAQEALQLASEALDRATARRDHAQQQMQIAQRQFGTHSEAAAVRRNDLTRLKAERDLAEQQLARAREEAVDERIVDATKASQARCESSTQRLQVAEQELRDADAESAAAMLKNALKRRDRHAATVAQTSGERAATRALLDHDGHSGLADKRSDAAAAWESLRQQIDGEDRRADAAELLYKTLARNRREAYSSFATPFRERLNQYARIVFGPAVEVHIDPETLQILSRTLGGVTVVFDHLSGGAREQLAILARLSVASIICEGTANACEGPSAGVPVMIDDALGYSDSSRLERLGAVFSEASEYSQVIVLTCMPGRYSSIGNAKTVRLR